MSIGQDKTRLDFVITRNEKLHLEQYCTRVGRTKTDVLRELIRGLPSEAGYMTEGNLPGEEIEG